MKLIAWAAPADLIERELKTQGFFKLYQNQARKKTEVVFTLSEATITRWTSLAEVLAQVPLNGKQISRPTLVKILLEGFQLLQQNKQELAQQEQAEGTIRRLINVLKQRDTAATQLKIDIAKLRDVYNAIRALVKNPRYTIFYLANF